MKYIYIIHLSSSEFAHSVRVKMKFKFVRLLSYFLSLFITDYTCMFFSFFIVRLSLLTMTNLNHMREMLLFVCSKMTD